MLEQKRQRKPDDASMLENQPTNRMFPDYLSKGDNAASNRRAVKSSLMAGEITSQENDFSRQLLPDSDEQLNELKRGLRNLKPNYDSTSASLPKISYQHRNNLSAARLEKSSEVDPKLRSRKAKHLESNPQLANLFELQQNVFSHGGSSISISPH